MQDLPQELPQDLVGKVALVTGGNKGIGLAIADELQAQGAQVFTAQRTANNSNGSANNSNEIQADFTDKNAPQQVIDTIITQTGRLDILINNAGMMQEASIEATSLLMWQNMLDVNLTAPFLLIQAALPYLKKSKNGGAIVNIGSIEGIGANPSHAGYVASKAGLHGLTRAVAVDCGGDNVRCNIVAPGWIDTDLNNDFIAAQENPENFKQNIGKIHPLGRTGNPREVAKLVAFLASAQSSFITGQIYVIDGGRTAKLSLPVQS